MIKVPKLLCFLVVLAGVIILYALFLAPERSPQKFGVTFSIRFADQFKGITARETLVALLDDLGVRSFRIPIYWDEIEKNEGVFDFSSIDWQLEEIQRRNGEVILAVGRKLPRWPECFLPEWVKILSRREQQEKLLRYIEAAVERYKNAPGVILWQIENEPFLPFGEEICDLWGGKFLDKEIELVKRLDIRHPIMITDSGEISIWVRAAKRSDIFGSTLFRHVWHDRIGYFTYPISPEFFRLKRGLTQIFTGKRPMIISELQAEPWSPRALYDISVEDQYVSMNPERLQEMFEFIKRTGFDTFYLWGGEWWYWLKTQGHPEIWEIVRQNIEGKI